MKISPRNAARVARPHAQQIVDDLDGRGFLGFEPTFAQEQKLVEAIEHDLRESLENLRLSEEDGE